MRRFRLPLLLLLAVPSCRASGPPGQEVEFFLRGRAVGAERVVYRNPAGDSLEVETNLKAGSGIALSTSMKLDPAGRIVVVAASGQAWPWLEVTPERAGPFPLYRLTDGVRRFAAGDSVGRGETIQRCEDPDRGAPARSEDLAGECFSVREATWGQVLVWIDDDRLVAAAIPTAFGLVIALPAGHAPRLATVLAAAARQGTAAPGNLPDLPAEPLLVRDVRVIVGDGTPPREQQDVYIEDGRIRALGPAGSLGDLPAGVATLDGTGRTLLPGLWDMHAHLKQVEWLPAYLAAGVTTVRDLGNDQPYLLGLRASVTARPWIGPAILAAGWIDGPGTSHPATDTAGTPAEARRLVRRYHAAGYQQVKVWNYLSPRLLPEVTDEAHRLGMTVTGHVPSGMTLRDAVTDGLDQVNHVTFVDQDDVETLARAGTVVDPTLVVPAYGARYRGEPMAAFEPCAARMPAEVVEVWERLGAEARDTAAATRQLENAKATVLRLHRAGVSLVAGSDQGLPGCTLLKELELYVAAGLTPLEAIATATAIPARVSGLEQEVGTVSPGKRADLLLVEGNPAENINDLRRAVSVIRAGRRLDPEAQWCAAFCGAERRQVSQPVAGGGRPAWPRGARRGTWSRPHMAGSRGHDFPAFTGELLIRMPSLALCCR